MKILFSFLLLLVGFVAQAQFAPQAGQPGSTAVPSNSPAIKGWASQCAVTRGWMNIADKSLGPVSSGVDVDGMGAANGTLVSLGDSGVAVLQFFTPIVDGWGADFAVFENGFLDPADSQMAYLEVAFVEVSSDGSNFFRFPAQSLVDTEMQIAGAGVYTDCRQYHNLAGKYRSTFGTPFDLAELPNNLLLNKNRITHVRLVDAIGSIGTEGTRDAMDRKINDPFPTPFSTGGFDLDAVAVLNDVTSQGVENASATGVKIAPNPATDRLTISVEGKTFSYAILDATGRKTAEGKAEDGTATLAISAWKRGLYFVEIQTGEGATWREKIGVQ